MSYSWNDGGQADPRIGNGNLEGEEINNALTDAWGMPIPLKPPKQGPSAGPQEGPPIGVKNGDNPVAQLSKLTTAVPPTNAVNSPGVPGHSSNAAGESSENPLTLYLGQLQRVSLALYLLYLVDDTLNNRNPSPAIGQAQAWHATSLHWAYFYGLAPSLSPSYPLGTPDLNDLVVKLLQEMSSLCTAILIHATTPQPLAIEVGTMIGGVMRLMNGQGRSQA